MDDATRYPIVSGMFYPNQPDQLRRLVAKLLESQETPCVDALTSSIGLVVPHAGYMYSGGIAAAGFAAAAQSGRPEVVIILGASHTGIGPPMALSPHSRWQTPLGLSPVHADARNLLEGHGFQIEAASFQREHSIEVQLPFIQYLWSLDTPIVPICIAAAPHASVQEAARALSKVLQDTNGLLLASSDFTHYESDSRAREADAAAMDRILALDVPGFHTLCEQQQLTICGATAIELLMATARESHWSKTRTVAYATSGDVTGDRSSVVGYASLLMTKENYG